MTDGFSVGKFLTPSWYTIHPNKSLTRTSASPPTRVSLPCQNDDPSPREANAFPMALTKIWLSDNYCLNNDKIA